MTPLRKAAMAASVGFFTHTLFQERGKRDRAAYNSVAEAVAVEGTYWPRFLEQRGAFCPFLKFARGLFSNGSQ